MYFLCSSNSWGPTSLQSVNTIYIIFVTLNIIRTLLYTNKLLLQTVRCWELQIKNTINFSNLIIFYQNFNNSYIFILILFLYVKLLTFCSVIILLLFQVLEDNFLLYPFHIFALYLSQYILFLLNILLFVFCLFL